MTENNTKLTKPQLIIGSVVLVIILFFVFSNKPATEQTPNLQEQSTKELKERQAKEYNGPGNLDRYIRWKTVV